MTNSIMPDEKTSIYSVTINNIPKETNTTASIFNNPSLLYAVMENWGIMSRSITKRTLKHTMDIIIVAT